MISAKKKKKTTIQRNYIKNTAIYQSFIEIKWFVDFRKDPLMEFKYYLLVVIFQFPNI